jgi:phage terminase small subunit
VALTSQQELFAQGVAAGKSQSEAYRSAYPKALSWAPETVWNRASALMRDSEVVARVEAIRAELAEKGLWSREQSVKALIGIINRKMVDEATGKEIQAAQDKDVISAVKELNAMHGFNAPQKIEHTGADGGPVQHKHTVAPELTPEQWMQTFGPKS